MGIDYGRKRTGLAVTDPLQIIASPLETVRTHTLLNYLQTYCQSESVDAFVVGLPRRLDNSDTHVTQAARTLARTLQNSFPQQLVHLHDERFTSKMALEAMIAGGTTKKYRKTKGNIDKISATIILQSYLAATS
jgi:putative Holliday junction resolvase